MARDWYRKHRWSVEDEEDFFAHLARARTSNRPQYLRIQAYELMTTGRRYLLRPAIGLLDRCLADFPEEMEAVFALNDRAECFRRLGKIQEAVDDYRSALERQRQRPTAVSTAAEDFAWLVAIERLPDLYEEALSAIAEWKPDMSIVPKTRYRVGAASALILAALGQHGEASKHAKVALREAARKESGLRFHRFVGLVVSQDARLLRRLRAIAHSYR